MHELIYMHVMLYVSMFACCHADWNLTKGQVCHDVHCIPLFSFIVILVIIIFIAYGGIGSFTQKHLNAFHARDMHNLILVDYLLTKHVYT